MEWIELVRKGEHASIVPQREPSELNLEDRLVRSEVFLGFSFDLTVTCWIGYAKQGKAFGDLFVVQKALIRLIQRATRELACAGGAGTSSA